MKKLSASGRASMIALAMALAVAALMVVGCACSATSSASSSKSGSASASDILTIPNVVSLTQADADKALSAAGFAIGDMKREASDTVPAGSVISQDPKAFTSAQAGTKVNLVISSGKAEAKDVKVPDLKGKTQADAEKALADAKLVGVASNPEESTEVAPGHVFKQSIAAGTTVKEGARIAFTVAIAPGEATVPNVAGMTRDDAKAALVNAKLGFDSTVSYDDKVEEGKVISQSIAAGKKVTVGTTVSVVVSLGKKPASDVKVPDVTTHSWSDAERALVSAGLKARYTGDPAGVVVSQDVAPGTMVAPGTLVTVKLESTVEMVTVPNLVGLSVTSAEAETGKVNLVLDISGGGTHGTVKSQWPEAGQQVPVRTTVVVEVEGEDSQDMSAQSAESEPASEPQASLAAEQPSNQAAPAQPVAPDASSFVGNWASGNAKLTVKESGGSFHVTIVEDGKATWEYTCALDGGKLVASNKGVKKPAADGSSDAGYTDGSATFSLNDAGNLIWKDAKEDAGKGLKFSRG